MPGANFLLSLVYCRAHLSLPFPVSSALLLPALHNSFVVAHFDVSVVMAPGTRWSGRGPVLVSPAPGAAPVQAV